MAMRPIEVDEAIEIAKEKGLVAGKVKGTEGLYFTFGKGDTAKRLIIISWEEFKELMVERKLQIFESGGFMKIMKK